MHHGNWQLLQIRAFSLSKSQLSNTDQYFNFLVVVFFKKKKTFFLKTRSQAPCLLTSQGKKQERIRKASSVFKNYKTIHLIYRACRKKNFEVSWFPHTTMADFSGSLPSSIAFPLKGKMEYS